MKEYKESLWFACGMGCTFFHLKQKAASFLLLLLLLVYVCYVHDGVKLKAIFSIVTFRSLFGWRCMWSCMFWVVGCCSLFKVPLMYFSPWIKWLYQSTRPCPRSWGAESQSLTLWLCAFNSTVSRIGPWWSVFRLFFFFFSSPNVCLQSAIEQKWLLICWFEVCMRTFYQKWLMIEYSTWFLFHNWKTFVTFAVKTDS